MLAHHYRDEHERLAQCSLQERQLYLERMLRVVGYPCQVKSSVGCKVLIQPLKRRLVNGYLA